MSTTHELKVGMTCSGCAGAVTRVLGKVAGVTDVVCDVEAKQVKVVCDGPITGPELVEALSKWSNASGKSVEYVGIIEQ